MTMTIVSPITDKQIAYLDQRIKTLCPADGISIGLRNDKSTWKVNSRPEATPQQIATAQTEISNFDTTSLIPADVGDSNFSAMIAERDSDTLDQLNKAIDAMSPDSQTAFRLLLSL